LESKLKNMGKTIIITLLVLFVITLLFSWNKPFAYNPSFSNSASLNFPSTLAGAFSDLTISVTGAATGDIVDMGVPTSSTSVTGAFYAFVSATNTVTVRYVNTDPLSATDPASGTFKVLVIKQ
jgi:hypothetical protein